MRILYHHRIRSKDGQFVHIEELTEALRELGHEIVMVGPAAVEKEEFGADAGWVAVLKKGLPRFLYELMEFSYAFVDYYRLRRAARRHKPDCLYERYNLYLPSGVWLHRRLRLPMLLEVNAPLYDERKKYDGIALDRFARWTERYTWRGADYVLPVTRALADHVRRTGVNDDKIVVIPNGINTRRFAGIDTVQAKAVLGLSHRLVLGFVGFMREWHGLDQVIRLVSEQTADRYHALLVGDGPARPALERLARSLGVADRVTITGIVKRDRVARYIAAFDVALQPWVVPYASPLKLFEYLALGRAIVAPALPNIKEILTDGKNALLYNPENAADFEDAIRRLCRDDELRARIAHGAAQTIAASGLTWANNAARTVELFRRLGVHG